MEEKNELNDIILNKSSSNTASKKLLLAIATFTLILIIVLVIMNSLKNDEVQKSPQAILPPEPTAPTEIINDPLFEPVEIIQEGNETAQGTSDLNQVAQKIKEESLQNIPPTQNTIIEPVAASIPAQKSSIQAAPVAVKSVPAPKPVKTQPIVDAEKVQGKPVIKQVKTVQPKKSVQAVPKEIAAPVVASKTPEVKTETKAATAPSPGVQTTYYIQVGSFTNEPNKALFDRLNASGMKYTTQKSGSVTKVLVGPFQGEKSVQDAMGTIRQNVEAKAFKIKG
ncbi:MAG: SPOR domain-containing protein [Sulfuricurvum sp.]|jgi:DedD protein|nr:SPOR domain-containing protein [Sulfuricurvum sp.]MDP3023750.1 SPOR domain-containing protein [Sulfuricurvum sp.]MDP3119082.1 SPOR domain-containing protein [Sulfuricurvum sp.]